MISFKYLQNRLHDFLVKFLMLEENKTILAEEQKQLEEHNEGLTEEINKSYEKVKAGKAKFYSSESAEQIITLRKKRIKSKYQ